jgi:hypothetical protein
VAGGGPAMVRRERKVSSTLHGRETTRGRLGRRSPWMKLATAEDGRTTMGFRHGGGAASDSGDGAVGTGRGEARRFGQRQRSGRNDGAAGMPARGPDSAFNVRAQCVAATRQRRDARRAQRGQRHLAGGTHSSAFSELKLPRTKIAQNK